MNHFILIPNINMFVFGNNKHWAWVLLCGFMSVSCGDKSRDYEMRTIYGNVEEADTIDISSGKIIPLETNDSSLLYGINEIEKVGGRLIVYSRELLKSFDPETGKYLGVLANQGEGPGEYNEISQMWAESDTVRLYDFNTRAIFSYLPDGTFLSRVMPVKSEDNPSPSVPSYMMKDPASEGYIILNSFTDGTTETNPTASYYDKDFNFMHDIEGRSMRDGSYMPDRMSTDKDGGRLMMWEGMIDTLFTVTADGIRPWLVFDFGKNKFPEEFQGKPGLFERANIFAADASAPYLSYLRCYQKLGDELFFCATMSDMTKSFLCV